MALVSSYDGFIFDYGGVLVEHQSAADQARMAKIAGLPPELFTELYWSTRQEYDKDLISYTEYWFGLAERGGTSLTAQQIDSLVELDTQSWMQFDSLMWNWVGQLRAAGKRVAMLSNMPRELGEALKLQGERLAGFDHVTLSYEVRAAKPEPVVYEECLEGIGTDPAQTLFLDDRIENIQAAELLGIRAIQFTSRDDVLLRLRA